MQRVMQSMLACQAESSWEAVEVGRGNTNGSGGALTRLALATPCRRP